MGSLIAIAGAEGLTITSSVTSLVGYLNEAVKFLTGNEVTLLFLAGAVIALAMKLFKRARRAVS